MENLEDLNSDLKDIKLDNNGITQLAETRKWTMFLSVSAFVFLGLMIVIGLVAGTVSPLYPLAPMFFLLIMVGIYFFPIYYLFQFSKYSKLAINNLDTGLLSKALQYLKMHYRFMGILFIVIMGLYIILGTGALFFKGIL